MSRRLGTIALLSLGTLWVCALGGLQQPLAQAIRRTEVFRGGERLGRLLGEPRGGQLAFDVFAVEEVAEDELVPE